MPHGHGASSKLDLLEMMQGLFKTETIEDYTCIKCSIRQHLQSFGARMRHPLKTFLERLVSDNSDLDEDQFREAWRDWKQRTGDQSKLTIDFIKRNISRSMQILKPPKILCVHINRVAYSPMGAEVLNSAKVEFPEEFSLDQISVPQSNGEGQKSQDCESSYKLAALVEHVGLTPHSGHYIAYKRLFPESLDSKRKDKASNSSKWLQANDERIQIIDEE